MGTGRGSGGDGGLLTFVLVAFLLAVVLFGLAYALPRAISPYPAAFGFMALAVGAIWLWEDYRPVAVLLLGAVLTVIGLWSGRRERRRRAVARLAPELGLTYTRSDPFALEGARFRLLSAGDGRVVENVLSGHYRGLPVRVADYGYYVVKGLVMGFIKVKRWRRFSVAVAELDVHLPHVSIGEEAWVHRLQGRDVEFELEEFNRRFRVEARERGFAYELIDALMMRWLLDAGSGIGLEVRGDRVLVSRPRLPVPNLHELLDVAVGFRDHIPRVVRSRYPTAPPVPEG